MAACSWKLHMNLPNQRETQTLFSRGPTSCHQIFNFASRSVTNYCCLIAAVKNTKFKVRGCGCNEEEYGVTEEDKDIVKILFESKPYFSVQRGRVFVVHISAEVIATPSYFHAILKDIAFLHHLGIHFVIVPGTHVQIDNILKDKGGIMSMIAAKLSVGPSICNIRRHGDNSRLHDVSVSVTSGNFLAAKRRGVVGGIDYGSTGEVKKIDATRMRERLDGGSIVILTNLGYSSSGEVLNCNTYEVATACALAIGADKLICVIDGPILDENGRLIRFLPLEEADMLIRKRAEQSEIAIRDIV